MNVVVVGATGFIGRSVCEALVARGDAVSALVREPVGAAQILPGSVSVEPWEPKGLARALRVAGAVINLAGEPIAARRWTPAVKARLIASRVEPAKAISSAMAEIREAGRVLVNASAVGYYGDCGEREVDETSPAGGDFLARLCVEWEAATGAAYRAGVRVVLLRSGIVLGKGGGALEALARPFRMLTGGPLGNGRQWVPWIHLDDEVRMVLWALDTPAVAGPLNAVAPNPVTNRELARELGRVLARPSITAAPAFALRLILGEFAETLLGGQRARPGVAERLGFEWRYPILREALSLALASTASGGAAAPH
jgi:uncharacterized protein